MASSTNAYRLDSGQANLSCDLAEFVEVVAKLMEAPMEQQFLTWLVDSFAPLLGGVPFCCGIGTVKNGIFHPRKVMHTGLPMPYLDLYRNADGISLTPYTQKALVSAGLEINRAVEDHLADRGDVLSLAEPGKTVALAQSDSHTRLTSFAGLQCHGRRTSHEHARTLAIVMPVLHSTLLKMVCHCEPSPDAQKAISGFSPREAEVAHWMMIGKSNWSIATILETKESSVKAHLRSIFNKLGVNGRTQAAAKLATLAQFSHLRS